MPQPRLSRAHPPFTVIAAVLLLAACDKNEEEPTPAAPPASPTTSGASVMLRGEFEAPDGGTLKVVQTLSIKDAAILQRIGENEIAGKMSVAQSEQQEIRFLKGGGREIVIGEGGSLLTTQLGDGDPIEESQPDKLTGKTLIGKAGPDGKWSYKVKGEPDTKVPQGFNAADLRSDELYPTEWKDFGDTWSPEPSALGALLGPGFQLSEGKIDMRLLGYAKRRDQPCAEIVANIEAKGLFRSGKARQDVSLKLKGKIYRSLHLYQDLEANLSGSIEMYQRMGNADVRIEGPVSFLREATWKASTEEEG